MKLIGLITLAQAPTHITPLVVLNAVLLGRLGATALLARISPQQKLTQLADTVSHP
jgi:hypothetical protein